MDLFSNVLLGLETALSVTNLFYCFLGVTLGILVGVIPGLGALTAISVLFPITFYLPPDAALIMLAGIWYGTTYGGSTAAILLNLPGTHANAVTCLDGYPLAQQGRGGTALLLATGASFAGGSIGILLLMLSAPVIAEYALGFGAAEYFSLIVLGLVAASTISDGSAVKGLAMVTLGVALGTVGPDIFTGMPRFSFGILELSDSISLIAIVMGLFGIAEVIASVNRTDVKNVSASSIKFNSILPRRDELRRSWLPMLRGSSLGAFFGTLPGTGPSIAAFMSYAIEKRLSKTPERFGNGAVEGVVAPEAANNAADQTAFIPTLTLGIPGSPTMALMIGALMVQGIAPGPDLMANKPELFWGLIMSFWIGNLLLVIMNLPLIGLWVKVLTVPYHILFPTVLMFICIGTYSVANSAFDVWLAAGFGLLGYAMRILAWPAAPLLLGFVLGPMLEEHFRRSMILSRGEFTIFVDRPISASVLAIALLLLLWSGWGAMSRRRGRAVPSR